MPFSRGSSRPRDGTWVSCAAGRFFTVRARREARARNPLGLRVLRFKVGVMTGPPSRRL